MPSLYRSISRILFLVQELSRVACNVYDCFIFLQASYWITAETYNCVNFFVFRRYNTHYLEGFLRYKRIYDFQQHQWCLSILQDLNFSQAIWSAAFYHSPFELVALNRGTDHLLMEAFWNLSPKVWGADLLNHRYCFKDPLYNLIITIIYRI